MKSLGWTSDLPTSKGFFWMRSNYGVTIIEVVSVEPHFHAFPSGSEVDMFQSDCKDNEFAGPLLAPE